MSSLVRRYLSVKGFGDRANDIIYHLPLSQHGSSDVVIFFGGDVQDYKENMMAHQENKKFVKWHLEATSELLAKRFPSSHIMIIKPASMYLGTFSRYMNFVSSNEIGIPQFSSNNHATEHLALLCNSISKTISKHHLAGSSNAIFPDQVTLVGFSKGCVVLNQLVNELPLKKDFVGKIRDFYWLDGGHAGKKGTWITKLELLRELSLLSARFHVHLTPYQICDESRPWIRDEENKFSDALLKLVPDRVERKCHFADKAGSIEHHFSILECF